MENVEAADVVVIESEKPTAPLDNGGIKRLLQQFFCLPVGPGQVAEIIFVAVYAKAEAIVMNTSYNVENTSTPANPRDLGEQVWRRRRLPPSEQHSTSWMLDWKDRLLSFVKKIECGFYKNIVRRNFYKQARVEDSAIDKPR